MTALPDIRDYAALRTAFHWEQPARFNIGVAACDRWAMRDPDRAAIHHKRLDGRLETISYAALKEASDRLANAFLALGVKAGDRVAILLPQSPEVVITHLALYKIGALALPLASVFGPDALEYRLKDSGARAIVLDRSGLPKLETIRAGLGELAIIISVDGADTGVESLHDLIQRASPTLHSVDTGPDDPAMMIYTSGTTGPPKGALHGHRVLLGHIPGVQWPHEFLPQPGDRMWTPADWAWAGGLLNVLLPSLSLGIAVVARRFEKFDPQEALTLIAETGVRNAFIPPTALKMMRAASVAATTPSLRTLATGGEALGAETYEWGRAAFGLTINEFYGQTECNLVLASCAAMGVSRAGAIGKPVPGHEVALIRPDGSACEVEEPGEIAIRAPNPVMFLNYWKNPDATARKFQGDWLLTGDRAIMDVDGYVRFVGRDDDIITSSGYRIGPSEIEDCLMRHPAIAIAAAVGKPDPIRTEIVRAFLVLKAGFAPSDALTTEIQAFVRNRLSAHEYPREIDYVAEVPLTSSGKVMRRILRERG